MSSKKKSPADLAKKELKAAVATLRAELTKAEKLIGRLSSQTGDLRAAKAELEKQVKRLRKKLGKASASAPAAAPPAAPAGTPDATWTVVQLRAEAASRGLTGIPSRATKAQLVAALAPPGD